MGGTFMSLPEDYRCGGSSHGSFLQIRDDRFTRALLICRDWFIRNLHDTLSGHTSNTVEEAVRVPQPPPPPSPSPTASPSNSTSTHDSVGQVRYSEQSRQKCIGITIETRPDYCYKPHLSAMLSCVSPSPSCCPRPHPVLHFCVSCLCGRYGCTRLEIGVQSVYEDVARDTNRCMQHAHWQQLPLPALQLLLAHPRSLR